MGLGDTYKLVCRRTQGVINHVRQAPNERDSDEVPVKEAKRLNEARRLQQRWLTSYFAGETIDIVVA